MKSYLKALIDSSQTVFTSKDLKKIWQIDKPVYLRVVISRLYKRQEIIRLQRGIYVISQNYDKFELANKLKSPSYVSLETVLQKENIIFQEYGPTVFSVSNNALVKKINETAYRYSKVSFAILSDPIGIEIQNGAFVASPERAICDRIYLSPNYYFDNLRPIKMSKLKQISLIYNKRVQKEIQKLIKQNAQR